ncbi:hypothetical protein SDRG_16274 [Saprolegnia diclina VS20]|uniref:Uncharacterized protein n=1 Tax=Saprolegnia diclina (strain VS20) TaxID=1156394 RepID=T0R8T4_SAPDV|nr:hypothetical protein SDRG_16274 [Saprolegnia diclina VS20]EQC25902.1 hypothetical protein SDRG_16274 [Saprolegnia diclina VS20]|eukprot:XP_008620698.1 hypothetical protein SDRG_16274 [Saprolegnia diclina VS20]
MRSWQICRLFRDMATCSASAERLLLDKDWISNGEASCRGTGSGESSCVTEVPTYYPNGLNEFSVLGIALGVLSVVLFGAVLGLYIKKKDRQMAASRPAIEATACSSKDGDDDAIDDDFPVSRASNYVRDDSSDDHELARRAALDA